ncbi:Eco57I restriction-modification methylase domain-containing protein [Asanoa siamensis]|uniref:site-specific DNA-methyltransferase (adenine-specific) n=1 Tax=Asanoa siamensis TaxID=926357 RepID=A0ABQ4CYY1_9ACTN|nr:Eco57I restriction-modification methylase domain-containing protein [Asanoa siamensis]GIF76495.1 type II DNA modification methyltransferase [Asanoa siamensis]
MTITADETNPRSDRLAKMGTTAGRGEVFTRRWIVELILDLCGYTDDKDLTGLRLLDPAVGAGAFLSVALDRLLAARARQAEPTGWADLSSAISAVDIEQRHVLMCREAVADRLRHEGCPAAEAAQLASAWVRRADFLLDDITTTSFNVIVGNPPYVRIEDLEADLLAAYRRARPTMGGRADIYVGFYERALDLLAADGQLGFICADRWMRNQYGRALRAKILNEGYAIDTCLVMHDVAAFEADVSAYPAITVIRRGAQRSAVVGDASENFDGPAAANLVEWAQRPGARPFKSESVTAAILPHWHDSADSWPDGTPSTLAWLESLAEKLPVLEDEATGTRIRIGVATGADAVYVTRDPNAVEEDRLLPLAMPADIRSGSFEWNQQFLINPWDDDGLVDLDDWPLLSRYLQRHGDVVRRRAVAKNNPARWYRTIDRVSLEIKGKRKLLLEDLKAKASPVLEPGDTYPHHNLYYIVSDAWDLEVLGGLLLSEVVERQVAAYCVKMRGRTLRFQAQYLRRVRAPQPDRIDASLAVALREAFQVRDRAAATAAALEAYGMSHLPE